MRQLSTCARHRVPSSPFMHAPTTHARHTPVPHRSINGLENDVAARDLAQRLGRIPTLASVRLGGRFVLPAATLHGCTKDSRSQEIELGNKGLGTAEMVSGWVSGWLGAWVARPHCAPQPSCTRPVAPACCVARVCFARLPGHTHNPTRTLHGSPTPPTPNALTATALHRCGCDCGACGQVFVAEALRFNRHVRLVNLRKNSGGLAGVEAVVAMLDCDDGQRIADANVSSNLIAEAPGLADKVAALLSRNTCLTHLKLSDVGLGVRDAVTIGNALVQTAARNRVMVMAARKPWEIEAERKVPRELGTYVTLRRLRLHTVDIAVTQLLNGHLLGTAPKRAPQAQELAPHKAALATSACASSAAVVAAAASVGVTRRVVWPRLPQMSVLDLAVACAFFTHRAVNIPVNELDISTHPLGAALQRDADSAMSLLVELVSRAGPKLRALNLAHMSWSAEALRPAMRALAVNTALRSLSLRCVPAVSVVCRCRCSTRTGTPTLRPPRMRGWPRHRRCLTCTVGRLRFLWAVWTVLQGQPSRQARHHPTGQRAEAKHDIDGARVSCPSCPLPLAPPHPASRRVWHVYVGARRHTVNYLASLRAPPPAAVSSISDCGLSSLDAGYLACTLQHNHRLLYVTLKTYALPIQDLRGSTGVRSQTYASCSLGVLDLCFVAEVVRHNGTLHNLRLDNNEGVTPTTVQTFAEVNRHNRTLLSVAFTPAFRVPMQACLGLTEAHPSLNFTDCRMSLPDVVMVAHTTKFNTSLRALMCVAAPLCAC